MKIFGISMVRNEADILRICLLHHLAIGCHHIMVVDNGSSDRTPRILRGLSRRHPISWTRDEGPFRQSETVTGLAREAARLGADWILSFDADEFWWPKPGSLAAVLSRTSVGVLDVPVLNFVQRRAQRRSTPGSLARMTWRVQPRGTAEAAHDLVERGDIALVEIVHPPKLVARATSTMQIGKGAHIVLGVPGRVEHTDELLCLHAPLRSRAALEAKASISSRVQEENPHPESAWHKKRWGRLAAAGDLDKEWAANSHLEGELDVYGSKRPLIFDPTLRELVWPWLSRRQRLVESLVMRQSGSRRPQP